MSASDLVFGTQYYRPPFPNREARNRDLNLIAASGMNTVKLWAVWSWIERSNGAYYFDDLDELVQLCGAKGLQIVINIVPEGAPYWLERLHLDARYKAENGFALEFSGAANLPSGGWPGLCLHLWLLHGSRTIQPTVPGESARERVRPPAKIARWIIARVPSPRSIAFAYFTKSRFSERRDFGQAAQTRKSPRERAAPSQ
jgi:Beta-galactosidase